VTGRAAERVAASTSERSNRSIRKDMERRLALFEAHPELIEERLRELDSEWDVERVIETEGATTTLVGLFLGAMSRRWLALPLFAQGMMAVHAVDGFYPLLPLLRRAGVRTQREIGEERQALRALRGDFRPLEGERDPRRRAELAHEATRLPEESAPKEG
jgi:hypothetical protein